MMELVMFLVLNYSTRAALVIEMWHVKQERLNMDVFSLYLLLYTDNSMLLFTYVYDCIYHFI